MGWSPTVPGNISTNTNFTAIWTVDDGGCYLTSAMVGFYGYDDDGIELNSMRAIREYMIKTGEQKYADMLNDYAEESKKIVAYIESQSNKEHYYQQIKDVVMNIVDLVEDGKLSEATETYWSFYLEMKALLSL